MRKSITQYFIIVLVLALVLTCSISFAMITPKLYENEKDSLLYEVKIMEYAIDYNDNLSEQIEELNDMAYQDETRVSIIDLDGEVLADTYTSQVSENHLNREEVQTALKEGVGYATRKSETTGQHLLYVAIYNRNHIVRLSVPYNGLIDMAPQLVPALLLSALISFMVAFIVSSRLSKRLSKPIIEISDSLNQMTDDYRFEVKEYKYNEFNIIVDTINNLSHRLRKSIKDAELEKEKIDEVLRQMNEGIVLLDEDNIVLSINATAKYLLGNVKVKDHFFTTTNNIKVLEAINKEVSNTVMELEKDEKIYNCYISKVNFGKAILFVDVTETKNNEKMRRDFLSNVTHELKTPMTSIRGYSDLLLENVITDEDKKTYMLEKIEEEVDRMSSLINDILELSRIENEDFVEEIQELSTKTMIDEILNSFSYNINKSNINIVRNDDITFNGNYKNIYTLLNNLIGNAVKYNKENGSIKIDITKEINSIKIVIKDTGIGIPVNDQSRIFERFYRVDKGRSRQLGGTGLGLAIVKHIVSHYQGTITLESKVDEGTTFTILLPNL